MADGTVENINDWGGLEGLSPRIAAELGAGLASVDEVRTRYGIPPERWERLRQNPAFRQMVREAIVSFSGEMGAQARIRLKALIATEDGIPPIYGLIHDKETGGTARVEAMKTLMKLAGVGAEPGTDMGNRLPVGEGFSVNIYLGGEHEKPLTIEGRVTPGGLLTDQPNAN